MTDKALLDRLIKTLVADGQLVEAGFVGLRIACGLQNAPAEQLREMRMAFFAGAHHLFATINSIMDPGTEPTEDDLERMDKIDAELGRFGEELKERARREAYAERQRAAPPPLPELGDAPIEDRHRQKMNDLAKGLDMLLNPGKHGADRETGFVLLVFPFAGHEGRCNYISNGADRKDIVVLFKEQIRRFEGAPDVEGHA